MNTANLKTKTDAELNAMYEALSYEMEYAGIAAAEGACDWDQSSLRGEVNSIGRKMEAIITELDARHPFRPAIYEDIECDGIPF